jgi:hypothetical protein
MFRDFLGALRDARAPEFTLARARRDLELVEMAYRTAQQHSSRSFLTSPQGS